MSGTHRLYHRRKGKSNAAWLGLAAALAGVLAIGAVAAPLPRPAGRSTFP